MTNDPSIPSAASATEVAPVVEGAPMPASARDPAPAPAAEGPLSGAPYRTMPETPSLPVTARRPSLLAAGVFVFGVLLWAFVVMGELTTSYGPGKRSMLMSEALAFVLVLVAAAAAWWVALSRSVEVAPPAGAFGTYVRGAVIAGLALALWLITLFCAIALAGGGSRSLDGPITMMLLIVSLAAALGGRRLAGLHVPAPAGGARILVRLVWVAASLLTFVAFALVAET